MIFSTINHTLLNFINYIYSDGFLSIKSISFTTFLLFLSYDLCKDWIDNIGVENDYFEKENLGNFKIQHTVKKKIENNKEEETLKLYKMFKK